MKLKFTEAALLGSTLIEGSRGHTVELSGAGCYLGMALEAIGRRTKKDDANYVRLRKEWPWLWSNCINFFLPYMQIYETYDVEGFAAAHALAQKLEEQYDKQEVPERECQLVQR